MSYKILNNFNTTTWPNYLTAYINSEHANLVHVDIKDKASVHPETCIEIDYASSIEDYIEHIYADVEKGIVVVKWEDGTVTKVATDNEAGENFDLEHGVNAAIVKKLYQSRNHFLKFIREGTTYVLSKKAKKEIKTR